MRCLVLSGNPSIIPAICISIRQGFLINHIIRTDQHEWLLLAWWSSCCFDTKWIVKVLFKVPSVLLSKQCSLAAKSEVVILWCRWSFSQWTLTDGTYLLHTPASTFSICRRTPAERFFAASCYKPSSTLTDLLLSDSFVTRDWYTVHFLSPLKNLVTSSTLSSL